MKRAVAVAATAAFALYLVVVLFFAVAQRSLVFPAPAGARTPTGRILEGPGFRGLWSPPRPGSPVVVHFHGNGEDLADLEAILDLFGAAGAGVLAVEYPGYGLSRADGPAAEASLYAAGTAALAYLRNQGHRDLVLSGQSLGTGVATEMAARGSASRLVLISPYTSMAEVAGWHYPWVPVRLLLRDRFDTASKAPRIDVPVLLLHGGDDEVVPASMSATLEHRFPHAKRVVLEDAGHNDLLSSHREQLRTAISSFLRGEGHSSRDKSK